MGKGRAKKRSKKRSGKGKSSSTIAMMELGDLRDLLESALFLTNLGVKKASKKKRKKMKEEEIEDSIGPHAVSHPLLATLSSARNALDESQMVVDSLVMSLRTDGVTWPQVGEALGVSAHAAQQRFGRRVKMQNVSY
jgi:microcompartment protein CcmK/EutM